MRDSLRLRLRILAGIVFLIAGILVVRLYFLQLVDGHSFALLADRQYAKGGEQIYDRGTIYATRKDGTLVGIATLASGFTLAINPSAIENTESLFATLSTFVPIDTELFSKAASKQQDPYEVIVRRIDDAIGKAIVEEDINGVLVERERWRLYPAQASGGQSIGFVAFDEENTVSGRLGLEQYYNDVLTRDREGLFGNFFAELFSNIDNVTRSTDELKEGNVVTTLEPVVLERLHETLLSIHETYGSAETGGIIMDPNTGAIIALDVVPGFDPNSFQDASPTVLKNPLVEHVYEFGSIVKPLTIASGLDAGVITPTSTYTDTGRITVNEYTISNFDGKARGLATMQDVLNQSLNLGVSHVVTLLGADRFREYFTRLRIGTETGIDLPGEVPGITTNLEESRDVELFTASFGQGIALTPVGMIRALSALAHDGMLVTPHLAREIVLDSGIPRTLVWKDDTKVFSKEAARTLTDMLVTVVDTSLLSGTVKNDRMTIAAKTGTAQIAAPNGGYYSDRYMHSFFGYFPAYEPRFIVLLYTREPEGVRYASETLTKPFMELTNFLIGYYAIPPDREPIP